MQRTQIYLPRTHIETLRKEALKQHSTLSQIIRDLVQDKIDVRHGIPKKPRSVNLLAATKRINTMGKRAPKDLASRMDHYLYQ